MYFIVLVSITFFFTTACSSDESDSDESCITAQYYQDGDVDGFGNPDVSQESCIQPDGFVVDNTDFDDTNATAFPGADEICDDAIDNNGDGDVDECGLLNLIAGNWTDTFNQSYTITETRLILTSNGNSSIFNILSSGDNFVICLNDSSNDFYADLYSKFVFINISENSFNLCQPIFDAPSESSVEEATDTTDPGDLDSGCGGFSWGTLTRN